MRASQVIAQLQALIEEKGDLEVVTEWRDFFYPVEEVSHMEYTTYLNDVTKEQEEEIRQKGCFYI